MSTDDTPPFYPEDDYDPFYGESDLLEEDLSPDDELLEEDDSADLETLEDDLFVEPLEFPDDWLNYAGDALRPPDSHL